MFHRIWPRKYGWLNFAILECSLNVSIVNKIVFTAPELREKCAAKFEVFPALLKIPENDVTETIFDGNFKHQYLTHYPIFLVKSYKRNQWNLDLPNILEYISSIFDDFFHGGSVPLKGLTQLWKSRRTYPKYLYAKMFGSFHWLRL